MVPPCDGAVSEEERRALGLPTRAEQRRAAEVHNRLQAEERCRQEGLPDGINLARVWCPTSVGSGKSRALTRVPPLAASVTSSLMPVRSPTGGVSTGASLTAVIVTDEVAVAVL